MRWAQASACGGPLLENTSNSVSKIMEPASPDDRACPADVLIVEDDPIIAIDFEDRCAGFGVARVRTVGSVARALQAMDFRVHAVGATISVDAPRERWKAVFAARFATVHRRREKRRTPGAAASAQHVSPVAFQVPAALEPLVESVVFVEPPELF